MTAPPGELERFDAGIGRVLKVGVLASTVLLALGLLSWLLGLGLAGAFLHAGLVALMATPVVRLLASLVEYVRTGEWFFVLMTAAVLAVLIGTAVYAAYER